MLRTVVVLIILILIMFTGGCGWERKVVFPASSVGTSLEIQQPFPINDWGLKVILVSKGRERELYCLRGDAFLTFADVVWSPEDKVVSLFKCGTEPLRLAYNLSTNKSAPFSEMQSMMAAHIREQYHLDKTLTAEDVFLWACSEGGQTAFLKLHPESIAR